MSGPISWRPSEAAAKALADLVERTGKKRSRLLDDLIIAAARGPEISAENDRGSAAGARARLNDALDKSIKKHGALPSQSTRPDPEKIAAAQVTHGMTVFDAKARKRRQ